MANATAAVFEGEGREQSAASAVEGMPHLQLGTYEGPLDLLLELARAQRVDLGKISMLTLAEQFVAAVEAGIAGGRMPLGQMGGWLVTAAALMALRARLLLPTDAPEHREAARDAATLRRQLAERAAVQRLTDWLEQRPQLGRDVFGRGGTGPEEVVDQSPTADITELLRACLRLLALPLREVAYQPRLLPLWRVPAALTHLRARLATLPVNGVALTQLIPPSDLTGTSPLQRRAGVASTLMAGLELSREGALTLDQERSFETIHVVLGAPEGS